MEKISDNNIHLSKNYFVPLTEKVKTIPLPERFTFPFYYEPHPLCEIAVKDLQHYLTTQRDFKHNFGLEKSEDGTAIGKMFGVLVVQNNSGVLGYIAAFSGKLANSNNHKRFVPPVFDLLDNDGFFLNEEKKLNALNNEIEQLETDPSFVEKKAHFSQLNNTAEKEINEFKKELKIKQQIRQEKRENAIKRISKETFEQLNEHLKKESISGKIALKHFSRNWKNKLNALAQEINQHEKLIIQLKNKRKDKSAALQKKIFEAYTFLNEKKEEKSLLQLFEHSAQKIPPAGAGECAAPKLLHYAFLHSLKPIAMAEFWWGASPKTEIRKHKHFYPACKGKCEPILKHILSETKTDPNPMLVNPAEGKQLEIIFEDESIIVVNKPENFLSVPGKNIVDSVYNRIKTQYPQATGPLLVHRLDMSTSGILLIAKTTYSHKFIQRQFIKRSIKKRYVALLDGLIKDKKGNINLPLRVDLDDRPRQLVCYDHGKNASTDFEIIEAKSGKTKVYFYPLTGRTHQLRVHAAHPLGLNTPIVGDDLYGKKSKRLYLHANKIEFVHPISKNNITFEVEETF